MERNGCRLTKVFRFNNEQLVVGDSIEDAIAVFRKYYDGKFVVINSVEAVYGDSCGLSDSAIILEKKD